MPEKALNTEATVDEVRWLMDADGRMAIAVLGGLLLFSWSYDRWVARVQDEGKDRGYLSLIVALGFAVTVFGFGLWTGNWGAAGQVLVCCAASGSFMIIGSIRRYQEQRAREETQTRREVEECLERNRVDTLTAQRSREPGGQ